MLAETVRDAAVWTPLYGEGCDAIGLSDAGDDYNLPTPRGEQGSLDAAVGTGDDGADVLTARDGSDGDGDGEALALARMTRQFRSANSSGSKVRRETAEEIIDKLYAECLAVLQSSRDDVLRDRPIVPLVGPTRRELAADITSRSVRDAFVQ